MVNVGHEVAQALLQKGRVTTTQQVSIKPQSSISRGGDECRVTLVSSSHLELHVQGLNCAHSGDEEIVS